MVLLIELALVYSETLLPFYYSLNSSPEVSLSLSSFQISASRHCIIVVESNPIRRHRIHVRKVRWFPILFNPHTQTSGKNSLKTKHFSHSSRCETALKRNMKRQLLQAFDRCVCVKVGKFLLFNQTYTPENILFMLNEHILSSVEESTDTPKLHSQRR